MKTNDYSQMTTEDFDRILDEIVESEPHIISIPGVYEILSEYFNNEVLDRWQAEQATDDESTEA